MSRRDSPGAGEPSEPPTPSPPGGRGGGARAGGDRRGALLLAARRLFAEHGYDRTTMRAVARGAGADPALIYHYFPGGKAQLLEQVLHLPPPLPSLMQGVGADPDGAGAELVRRALAAWDSHPQIREQGVALIRITVGSRAAVETMRHHIRTFILGLVGDVLAPDNSELRLGLVIGQMHGLLLHRYVFGIPPLATADPDTLVATIGPTLQRYINGDLGDLPDPTG